MVRREPTAEDSFAAIRDRRRFGIAMAAMIKMIATTISNSIREKPFCLAPIMNDSFVSNNLTAFRRTIVHAASWRPHAWSEHPVHRHANYIKMRNFLNSEESR
jgi:hypothetical protein